MIRFRAATYNVHKCVGIDRRLRPERVLSVLRAVDADVIAVQEIFDSQASLFARELKMDHRFAAARQVTGEGYGNAVFSRFPILDWTVHDLTAPGREARNCLELAIAVHERQVHVFAVHLGTSFFERRRQSDRLLSPAILGRSVPAAPRIVLGDFNEWTRGRISGMLSEEMSSVDVRQHLRRSRTYPGVMPFFHLDHIYHDPALHLEHLRLHRTAPALLASDHLPLLADFGLPD